MSDKKLPAIPQKSVTALREDELFQTLDQMRKETPPQSAPQDDRVLNFICACSSKHFRARFSRSHAGDRYRVAAIEKGGERPASGGPSGSWGPGAQVAPEAFEASEFYLRGWHCPWCNAGAAEDRPFRFARCSRCQSLVCSGRSAKFPDGRKWFQCHDGCGAAGWTSSVLEYFDGSVQGGTSATAQQTSGKLSGPAAARLPPPRR